MARLERRRVIHALRVWPPRRTEDGDKVGTYTLWIYMAEWSIKKARREIAHCESSDKKIHRAAEVLTGKKLESASLTSFVAKRRLRHGAIFRFEGGYHLIAWACLKGDDDDDIFSLHSPDACISFHRDGALISEPSTRE